MAGGDTMQGKRYPDIEDTHTTHAILPEGGYRREEGIWHVRPPGTDHGGSIGKHEVTEHEDGTITVSPSILYENPRTQTWHGYLERGVWREC